jgi:type II secretory pathway component GspD/PulD (secretin)
MAAMVAAAAAAEAPKAAAPSPQQLMEEARKLYAAHNYDAAMKRLQPINPDQLGLFERGAYQGLLADTQKAVEGKPADEKAFADGKAALDQKNFALAVAKLTQAANSPYLEDDKAGPAKGLLQLALDGQKKAVAEAAAKADADKIAQAKAEAEKAARAKADAEKAAKAQADAQAVAQAKRDAEKAATAKAFAEANRLYEARDFAGAQAQLKSVKTEHLGFFEKVFRYDPLVRNVEEATAGKAADGKALADGKAALAAKQYPAAIEKLSQAASSDYLPKGDVEAAKAQLAQANTEKARAEKEKADALAKAEAAKAKAETESKAASAKALAAAERLCGARDFAGAQVQLKTVKTEDLSLFEKWFTYDPLSRSIAKGMAEKTAASQPPAVAVVAKPAEAPAPKPVAVVAQAPAPVTLVAEVKPVQPKPGPTSSPAPKSAPKAAPKAAPAKAGPGVLDIMTQARHAEAEDEMKLGEQALAQHEYEKAKIHYTKAVGLWPDSQKAKKGLDEALKLAGEREEPLSNILQNVQSVERQKVIADVQELLALAERAMGRVERPEDYNEGLRPLAQADRTIDVATVLSAEEQERLREEVLVLRKQIQTRKSAAENERAKRALVEANTREGQRRAADKADRENKIKQLWERATELRRSMQFPESIQMLDLLLAIDPTDERAQRWKEDLLFLDGQSRQVQIRRQRESSTVEALVDTEDASIPVSEMEDGRIKYLRYPVQKDWKELTEFRRDFTRAVSAEPKAVTETRRRLSEEIDLDFEKTTLDNVLKYISEVQRGLNIVIDPDVAAGGIDLSTRMVDLKVKRVSVESVLGLILGADLGYKVEPGYILVTTKDKMQQNLPVVTYPVQDLVAQIPDFADQAPRFEVSSVLQQATQTGGGAAGGLFAGAAAAAGTETPGWQELVAIIQRTVSNQSDPAVAAWSDEGGPAAIEFMNGLLIVTQTRRGHEKVADLLEQLRRERAIMISVESRYCQVSDQFLQDITLDVDAAFIGTGRKFSNVDTTGTATPILDPIGGVGAATATLPGIPASVAFPNPAGQPIIVSSTGSNAIGTARLLPLGGTAFAGFLPNEGGMVVSGTFLDDVQVGFLLRAIQADIRSTTLQAPRITLYNGQRSYISVSTVVTYISDAEPVVAEDAVGWDVQISAVPVGVTLDVKATVSADRRYVQMDLRPQLATLDTSVNQSGFQTYTITAAVAFSAVPAQYTIELPRVIVQDFKTTVSVPDGGTLLLGGTRKFQESEVETGVPILSKIPIIKRLFDNRASYRQANNLLILIKPKIIIQAEEEHRLGYDNF